MKDRSQINRKKKCINISKEMKRMLEAKENLKKKGNIFRKFDIAFMKQG